MAEIRNTTLDVEIITPEGVELRFDATTAPHDLLHVHTHNDMSEPCGTFTLTFAGRRVNGLTYDELIPLRSEVTIRLQDPRDPVSRTAAVVMRGLTDDHVIQEQYHQRATQRIVTISGRSPAGLLLDAHLFYHPLLEQDPHLGTIRDEVEGRRDLFWQALGLVGYEVDPRRAIGTILTFYLGLPSAVPLVQRRLTPNAPQRTPAASGTPATPSQVPAPGTRPANTLVLPTESDAGADQKLREELRVKNPGITPTEIENVVNLTHDFQRQGAGHLMTPLKPDAQRRQQTRVLATARATPPPGQPTPREPLPASNQLLNLQLPGRRTVADLLVYQESETTLFTPGITVFVGQNTPEAGALWNYLGLFVDSLMQEFFSRIEGGTCRLHFRGKPFLKEFPGTGSRFVDNEPTLETIALPWGEVLQRQQRRQTSNVYNFFIILPLGALLMSGDINFKYHIVPQIARNPDDPNAVKRYGIRVMQHTSPYLSAARVMPGSESVSPLGLQAKDKTIELAIQWGKWASVWYGAQSEMYTGFVTLPGSPRYNLGHRLTWEEPRGTREAYCEGVDHDWDAQTGRYITQLRYTRAWYLSGAVDRRRKAGSTNGTVPNVAGGGTP